LGMPLWQRSTCITKGHRACLGELEAKVEEVKSLNAQLEVATNNGQQCSAELSRRQPEGASQQRSWFNSVFRPSENLQRPESAPSAGLLQLQEENLRLRNDSYQTTFRLDGVNQQLEKANSKIEQMEQLQADAYQQRPESAQSAGLLQLQEENQRLRNDQYHTTFRLDDANRQLDDATRQLKKATLKIGQMEQLQADAYQQERESSQQRMTGEVQRLEGENHEANRQLQDQLEEANRQLQDQLDGANRQLDGANRQLEEANGRLEDTHYRLREVQGQATELSQTDTFLKGLCNQHGQMCEAYFTLLTKLLTFAENLLVSDLSMTVPTKWISMTQLLPDLTSDRGVIQFGKPGDEEHDGTANGKQLRVDRYHKYSKRALARIEQLRAEVPCGAAPISVSPHGY